jgi:hypothetical protein
MIFYEMNVFFPTLAFKEYFYVIPKEILDNKKFNKKIKMN